MDDSTTSSEPDRDERLRYVFELLLDLFFVDTFSGDFDVFFFSVLVGVEKARLGKKLAPGLLPHSIISDSPSRTSFVMGQS